MTGGWTDRPFILLRSVDSTNRFLKERSSALPHGTVCVADWQSGGRGRLGRSWTVPPGQTLAMSVLFREEGVYDTLPLLCGMAVTAALRELTGDDGFQIKWPNDIVCRQRKVCGILCESRRTQEGVAVVAGIGVNLLQTPAAFAASGLPYAGSVKQLTGRVLTPRMLAPAVTARLDALWRRCRETGFAAMKTEYVDLCLNMGRPVRVLGLDGDVQLEGTATGVGEDGSLRVETPAGPRIVRAGEASVRGLYGYV